MRETGAIGRRPSPHPRSPQDRSAMAASSTDATRRRGGNRRRYIAGLSVAAVVAAVTAGMMSTGNAYAEGEGDTVVFNGHCGVLGLGQASKPDKGSLSVSDEDKVTFVNNLGSKATLLLGQEKINVPDGGEYTTTLAKSSEALMAPDCMADLLKNPESAHTVTISVTAAPEDPPADNRGSGNSGDSGDSGNSSGDNDDVGVPSGGQDAPLDAEDPAASDAVPDPDGEKDGDKDAADEDAETGSTSGTDTATGQNEQVEAVDVGTIEETGSSGLLALLATVCLVGVAVAAIRTMMTQRAAAG